MTDLNAGRGNSLDHGSHCSDWLSSLGAYGCDRGDGGDSVHNCFGASVLSFY